MNPRNPLYIKHTECPTIYGSNRTPRSLVAVMASSCFFQLAVTILTVLVHVHADEPRSEPYTLDFDKEVEKFVLHSAQISGVEVSWWDAHGEHPYLKEHGFTGENDRVTLSAERAKYGEMLKSEERPERVYTQWIHNGQPSSPQTFTLKRETQRKTSFTWRVDKGIHESNSSRSSHSVQVTVGWPQIFGFSYKYDNESTKGFSLDKREGEASEVATIETFTVDQVITIPPMKSVKVDWIITDVIKTIPWTAAVKATGRIAVYFNQVVDGKSLWFYNIESLSGPHLKSIGGNTLEFIARGTFTAVKAEEGHLNITEVDYNQMYDRKPSGVRSYTIPLNPPQRHQANAL